MHVDLQRVWLKPTAWGFTTLVDSCSQSRLGCQRRAWAIRREPNGGIVCIVYYTILYYTMTILYYTILYYTTLYSTILYYVIV